MPTLHPNDGKICLQLEESWSNAANYVKLWVMMSLSGLVPWPKNLKGGIGSLHDPCVNALSGDNFDNHVWR